MFKRILTCCIAIQVLIASKTKSVHFAQEVQIAEWPLVTSSASSEPQAPPEPQVPLEPIDEESLDWRIDQYINRLEMENKTPEIQGKIRKAVHQVCSYFQTKRAEAGYIKRICNCFQNKLNAEMNMQAARQARSNRDELIKVYIQSILFIHTNVATYDDESFIHCNSFYTRAYVNEWYAESCCKNLKNCIAKCVVEPILERAGCCSRPDYSDVITEYVTRAKFKSDILKMLYIMPEMDRSFISVHFYLLVPGTKLLLGLGQPRDKIKR